MYCGKCGNELKKDNLFCDKCGHKAELDIIGEKKDKSFITLKIKYNKKGILSPKEKKIIIDGNEVIINEKKTIKCRIEQNKDKQEHIIKWDETNLEGAQGYFKFVNNGDVVNIVITFGILNGVSFKITDEESRNNNNVNNNWIIIGFIVMIILGFLTIRYAANKHDNSFSTSSNTISSEELSDEKEQRLFEATVNYLNQFYVINGKALKQGTFKCVKKEGDAYIYQINIEYNPRYSNHKGSSYIDTSKVMEKTVFTVYYNSTDTFKVCYSLSEAEEKINN